MKRSSGKSRKANLKKLADIRADFLARMKEVGVHALESEPDSTRLFPKFKTVWGRRYDRWGLRAAGVELPLAVLKAAVESRLATGSAPPETLELQL
jgi:hypothetical protein